MYRYPALSNVMFVVCQPFMVPPEEVWGDGDLYWGLNGAWTGGGWNNTHSGNNKENAYGLRDTWDTFEPNVFVDDH